MMRGSPQNMTAVDAAWLRMDSLTQRMIITAVFRFAEPIGFGDIEQLVRERVLTHARFRQRAVESRLPFGVPRWVDVPELELGAHLHRVMLPAPGDEVALAHLIGRLASTPLDRDRPLWQLHFVEGLHVDARPRPPLVIFRVHHAIGDGVSLVRFLVGLADQVGGHAKSVGMARPERPHGALAFARIAARHARSLLRMLLIPPDRHTVFRGARSGDKRVGWTRPFSLEALRTVAHAHGAKLNDVLIAVVAGAVRRYLEAHGPVPPIAELRALVPFFVQDEGAEDALGNHFGLVFLPLLIGIADPSERVRASKARNDIVKGSVDALVAVEVLEVMGAAGPAVEAVGIDVFTRKASVMITNVSGPTGPLCVLGRRIEDFLVWAPVAGHVSTGISLITYGDVVRIGVLSDALRLPDPETLATACEAEVDALLSQ